MQCVMRYKEVGKKKYKIKMGTCQPLFQEGEFCQIKLNDDKVRTYNCAIGYKCTEVYKGAKGLKKCLHLHELEDGEGTDDPDLCKGGHIYGKTKKKEKCVSVIGVRLAESRALLHLPFPFKCDMTSNSKCEAQFSNKRWGDFGSCSCSNRNPYDAYCKFSGEEEYRNQFALFYKAASVSQYCHPDVVSQKIFYEWESCTTDILQVLAYK